MPTTYVLASVHDKRMDKGWTQITLAATADVSLATVRNVEHGGAVTRLTAQRLAKALECHWQELIGQSPFVG